MLIDVPTDFLDPLVAPILLERKRQKVTQQDLADMAGISRRALSMIERGGDCTLTTLRRLYTALNIDVQAKPHRPPTLDEQIERNRDEFKAVASLARRQREGG